MLSFVLVFLAIICLVLAAALKVRQLVNKTWVSS